MFVACEEERARCSSVAGIFIPVSPKTFVAMDFALIREISLPIHIGIGIAILLLGATQLVLRKGGKLHQRLGRLYVWAMLISFLTSFPASIYTGKIFLSLIGIFSLYLAFTGYRFAVIKESGRVARIDRLASGIFLFVAAGMLAFAAYAFFQLSATSGIILGVFGLIFLLGAFQDARHLLLRNNSASYFANRQWLRLHIGRIIGSYIAAVTAFLVNVAPFGSHLINWLLPTAVGMMLMVRFNRRYAPSSPKN